MTEKRFKVEVSSDNYVHFTENGVNVISIGFKEYADAESCKYSLLPFCNRLNKLEDENKELKHHIKKLEKEVHFEHMRAMFSTVKSFKGDVSKRYYYSEETDTLYDSANNYGQYDKILDKKEIAMLLNEYETLLDNGD